MGKALKNWFWSGAIVESNQANVQAVLDVASDSPNAAGITALNNFFDAITSYLSLAESIKIYAHKNAALTDFQLYNYINPAANKSTTHNAPTYGNNGYRSNGTTSYLLENINADRRAGIEDNFSYLVSTYSTHTADESLMMIGGASTTLSKRLYIQTKASSSMISRGYNDATAGPGGTVTNHDGFYSLTNNTASTLSRGGKDGSYGESALSTDVVSGLTNYNIATCAWNNNGSIIRFHSQADAEFVWHGYKMTDSEINAVRTAWEAYKTELGLS